MATVGPLYHRLTLVATPAATVYGHTGPSPCLGSAINPETEALYYMSAAGTDLTSSRGRLEAGLQSVRGPSGIFPRLFRDRGSRRYISKFTNI